jgi:hypothetical protein
MATYNTSVTTRGLGIVTLVLGILGAAFYWWVPLGIILSLSGLILGLFACFIGTPRLSGYGAALAGLLVSIADLALDVIIAFLGLQMITFTALR